MGADQVAELMRHVFKEALIISAPILFLAAAVSFLISLFQALTSLQDQTLSTVPRLLIVSVAMLVGLPWFLRRIIYFTVTMLNDFHRYIG